MVSTFFVGPRQLCLPSCYLAYATVTSFPPSFVEFAFVDFRYGHLESVEPTVILSKCHVLEIVLVGRNKNEMKRAIERPQCVKICLSDLKSKRRVYDWLIHGEPCKWGR